MSTECSEDNLPLVTIITPTYNSNPQYLKEAIESVLEQTYPKIEYIITDDGSSVFHEELIHELLEGRNRSNITWKIIRHAENIGTVKNMNNAIRKSHGEYIFPLAHDDMYYDERVIEEWVNEFLRTGNKVITTLRECWDINMKQSIKIMPTNKQRDYIKSLSPHKLSLKITRNNFIAGASTAYSRPYLQSYNLFDEKYVLYEDYPLYLKITKNNESISLYERLTIKYKQTGVTSQIKRKTIYIYQELDDAQVLIEAANTNIQKIIAKWVYHITISKTNFVKKITNSNVYDFKKMRIILLPFRIISYILRIIYYLTLSFPSKVKYCP